MDLANILRSALRSLRRAPVRSSLTALGIIIGVAAVITMLSIGNGARAQVQQLLATFDSNQIVLSARTPRDRWRNGVPLALAPGDGLNLADLDAIKTQVVGIGSASVQISAVSTNEIRTSTKKSDALITGIDQAALEVLRRKFVAGAGFGTVEITHSANVALISEFVAKNLFDEADPINRRVQIKNVPFTVIGVVEDRNASSGIRGVTLGDTSVYLPYTTFLRRIEAQAPIAIMVRAYSPALLGALQGRIEDLMESRRGGRKADFVASNVAEAVSTFTQGSRTMSQLLGAVATISLVVGGIGIMNIMLVNVTERTREIGLRLALGTRTQDILKQFLAEAIILSCLGGLIGIALGIVASFGITLANQWPIEVSPESLVFAVLCSAAVGTFFGYHPARRAAALEPIQALRTE